MLTGALVLVPGVTAFAQTPPSDPTTTTTTTTTTTAPPPPSEPTTTAPAPPPTEPPTTPAPPPPEPPPPPPPPAPGPICTIGGVVWRDTRGPAALCAEQVLLSLGYALTGPDDWFGLSSVNALKAYQRDQGLGADGVIGEQTGDRLGIWNGPRAGAPGGSGASCTIGGVVWLNTRGPAALCAEEVLIGLGYSLTGPDDWFGASSVRALRRYQRDQGLRVDGVIREVTGDRLGIWNGPRAGDAPPAVAPAPQEVGEFGLPANSGSGRRIVYHRGQQRIWAVEADGTVVKTHLVSGRRHEPYAGTHRVYSRSMYTYSTADPNVKWRYMVRFAHGPGGGRIGFHEIPVKFGAPLQSERQLGQPLSGGCVRQSTGDAIWMWNWAGIGTTVVVL